MPATKLASLARSESTTATWRDPSVVQATALVVPSSSSSVVSDSATKEPPIVAKNSRAHASKSSRRKLP